MQCLSAHLVKMIKTREGKVAAHWDVIILADPGLSDLTLKKKTS